MRGPLYELSTELGPVRVGLEDRGPDAHPALVYEGAPEATRYVRRLVYNLDRGEGRLLGDACTADELARALRDPSIASLVRRLDRGARS
jgi:hypothetical protein